MCEPNRRSTTHHSRDQHAGRERPASSSPNYDSEWEWRPAFHRLVPEGLAGGWASDDGAALHFRTTKLVDAVSSRLRTGAYRVEWIDGKVVARRRPFPYLGVYPGASPQPDMLMKHLRPALWLARIAVGLLLVTDIASFAHGSLDMFPTEEQQDTIRQVTAVGVLLAAEEGALWSCRGRLHPARLS